MTLSFAPLFSWWVLAVLVAVAGIVTWRCKGRSRWRLAALLLAIAALSGPRLDRVIRQTVDDVALVVVDDSASQQLGQRPQRTQAALEALRQRLAQLPHLQVRTLTVGGTEGTKLFQGMAAALAEIPPSRLAGVIVLTDGVIHDQPQQPPSAPFHVLLTADKSELDRRVQILSSPDYALVGKNAQLRYRLDGELPQLPVKIQVDGTTILEQSQPTGQDLSIAIPIAHAGSSWVVVQVAPQAGELTLANNQALVGISGIRDRLKVLLLSGIPHVGERMWRNLLKADPGVDLIHFTILRSPDKADPTPLSELALITFPVRELFEQRLPDFDVVILDRYGGGELPQAYLQRLAGYVSNGGALLLETGSELTSLAVSPLAQILPALPNDSAVETAFRPRISALGRRHPVTAPLVPQQDQWGPWQEYVPTQMTDAMAPMETPNGDPLLVLAERGKGRVAEILSATGWLWARGWETGGPYAELLRRTAHWLMKQPELEAEQLFASRQQGKLTITRQSLSPQPVPVTVTDPDGHSQNVPLTDQGDGRQTAEIAAAQPGLWRVGDGTHSAWAVDGEPLSLELSEVTGTERYVRPVVQAGGGHLSWLAEDGIPQIRRTRPGAAQSGGDWLGLVEHGATLVTGLEQSSDWPTLILLTLAALALGTAWWREAR